MSPRPAATPPPPSAVEFERRMRWGWLPTVIFLLLLASLLAVALISLLSEPRTVRGLGDDADVLAARDALQGHMAIASGGLRFESALGGPRSAVDLATAEQWPKLERAHGLLERANRRRPLDPRILTALGHVELAMRDYALAERRYRLALEFAPHYGEARLGLGTALAQRALSNPDGQQRRRLQLRAVAQFAAVRDGDPVYDCALYDHAMLLRRVGRDDDAIRVARAYFERDSSSEWATRLRAAVGPRS